MGRIYRLEWDTDADGLRHLLEGAVLTFETLGAAREVARAIRVFDADAELRIVAQSTEAKTRVLAA